MSFVQSQANQSFQFVAALTASTGRPFLRLATQRSELNIGVEAVENKRNNFVREKPPTQFYLHSHPLRWLPVQKVKVNTKPTAVASAATFTVLSLASVAESDAPLKVHLVNISCFFSGFCRRSCCSRAQHK